MRTSHINRTPFVSYVPFSHEQMEALAKALGIKWTYVSAQTIPKEKVEVCTLPPPSGKLIYIEAKYKNDAKI